MKFRMVDRILACEPRRHIRGLKTVSFEEYEFSAALGHPAHLPQTLVMESLFQLGAWLIVISSDFSETGLVVRLEAVRFHDVLRPGGRLLMEADVRTYRPDGIVFDGRALAEGRLIAEGRGCLAVPVDLAEYHRPEDMRVLYSEIFRPEKF